MYGLVLPQISITMKPQVLHRVTLQNVFLKTNRYGKYSITVSAIELWSKVKTQLKNMLLKDLSPNKIETFISNFYLKSH